MIKTDSLALSWHYGLLTELTGSHTYCYCKKKQAKMHTPRHLRHACEHACLIIFEPPLTIAEVELVVRTKFDPLLSSLAIFRAFPVLGYSKILDARVFRVPIMIFARFHRTRGHCYCFVYKNVNTILLSLNSSMAERLGDSSVGPLRAAGTLSRAVGRGAQKGAKNEIALLLAWSYNTRVTVLTYTVAEKTGRDSDAQGRTGMRGAFFI